MTKKEELRILRELLWKIGNAQAGYNNEILEKILLEIRYGYCYSQSNSYEGQSFKELEKLRIESLKRLDKI